jgi:hypothetical protein
MFLSSGQISGESPTRTGLLYVADDLEYRTETKPISETSCSSGILDDEYSQGSK